MESEGCDQLRSALKKYLPQSSDSSATKLPADGPPMVQIRFRPPFLQTSHHDARGDAIALVMENMAQRNIPLWAANMLGCEFADNCAGEIKTGKVEYVDGIYEAIDASSWSRQVVGLFEKYMQKCAFEVDQGVNGPLPVIKPLGWNSFPYSICSQKNRKPKMEDRHIILPSLAAIEPSLSNNMALFAIFDGHNGSECAAYAAAHFHECIISKNNCDKEEENNHIHLLKNAFHLLDNRMTLRCEKENIRSGTTASAVLIENGVAHLGWCGDSSIGVLQADKVSTLSRRHTPKCAEEKKRIEEAGGMVVVIQGEPRVNGVLNISRSLGDIQAKPMISSEPELKTYRISDDDYIIFLSSDGVWDQLQENEIFDAVITFISSRPQKEYEKMAEIIAQKAKESGASDNLTLIAVFLQSIPMIWEKFGGKENAGELSQ